MTQVALPRMRWGAGAPEPGLRVLPEETPIAIVHDATTTAVMMATPADLEDFAYGFSLTEGLIAAPEDVTALEIARGELGVEVRLWLREPVAATLAARRRRLAGPTGCGLCGIDSLAEAARPPPRVGDAQIVSGAVIGQALRDLAAAQALGGATRAVHAAAWWSPDAGVAAIREDVGRHNALDKLAGAIAREALPLDGHMLLLTSRVSVEMVQKAAMIGVEVLVAVSAPTDLAVRTAQAANMTLIAVARDDGFEVFTGAQRVAP